MTYSLQAVNELYDLNPIPVERVTSLNLIGCRFIFIGLFQIQIYLIILNLGQNLCLNILQSSLKNCIR